jgi:hypothetical protein
MVLGGDATYLYEMARAYAVVANGGRSVPMHGVQRIIDLGLCPDYTKPATCPKGSITDPVGEEARQLIDPAVAARMDRLLRDVVSEGTGRAAGVVVLAMLAFSFMPAFTRAAAAPVLGVSAWRALFVCLAFVVAAALRERAEELRP